MGPFAFVQGFAGNRDRDIIGRRNRAKLQAGVETQAWT